MDIPELIVQFLKSLALLPILTNPAAMPLSLQPPKSDGLFVEPDSFISPVYGFEFDQLLVQSLFVASFLLLVPFDDLLDFSHFTLRLL